MEPTYKSEARRNLSTKMASTYNAETNGSQVVSDLADQIKGKVILTTGVTPGGLGGTFVEAIAKAKPSLLILAGRNTANIQKAADAITAAHSDVAVRILQLDLGSLVSVREAAAQVNSWDDVPSVDVLVNNAAIMATKFSLSPEGVENQFATNHLGPFLFTNLIIEKILASKCPRIVNVGSDGHRFHPIRFDDYNFGVRYLENTCLLRTNLTSTYFILTHAKQNGEHYNEWYAYGQSKTANMLMALSLAEKLGSKRGLLAFSLHPGVILTNLAGHIDFSVSGANLGEETPH